MDSQMSNLAVFIRIMNSLKDDGALEREDWLILLPLMIQLTKQLKDEMGHRPILFIGLSGVQRVLEETLETIQEERTR